MGGSQYRKQPHRSEREQAQKHQGSQQRLLFPASVRERHARACERVQEVFALEIRFSSKDSGSQSTVSVSVGV